MVGRLGVLLLVCAGIILPAQDPPVKLESRVDASGNGEAVITNLNSVPLTAYIVQVFLEPCNPSPRPDVFRVVDAIQSPDAVPLMPSRTRSEPLGAARCNKVFTSVPGRAELRAAVYQDGTSFGNPNWVKRLLDSRRLELDQLDLVLNRLKAHGSAGLSREVSAVLDQDLAALQAKKTLPFPPVVDIRELVRKDLVGSRSNQIASTVVFFERMRDRLLDSRPPLR